jgi:hypothetical protein
MSFNPFKAAADKIALIVVEAVKNEYTAQGHKLTGALVDSIEAKVKETATGAKIEGLLLDYGIPVNTGVPRERVPYNPNKRSGAGFSKYIAGLQLFAELRFRVPKKEALNIAFAIARKHKKEGIPTRKSRIYSSTGRRTGAIQEGLQKVNDQIENIINELVTTYTQTIIIAAFKKNLPNVKITR